MKFDRIKTEWASLRLTPEGHAIFCTKSGDSTSCIYFETSERLKQAIDKKKIVVKNWLISVPNSYCITKSLELPADNLNEASRMLEFELASLVPIPLEEIVYGCTLIKCRDSLSSVLVYILKVTAVEDILEPYRAIGIQPGKVMVDSSALNSWFNANEKNTGPAINILFENSRYTILTSMDGSLRTIEETNFLDSENKRVKEQLANEVFYLKHELSGLAQGQIVVRIVASKEDIREIQKLLNMDSNENISKTNVLQYPDLVFWEEKTECQIDKLHYDTIVANGLLRGIKEPGFKYLNLLPKKILKKAQQKKLLINYVTTGVLLMFLVLSLWLNFVVMNWRVVRACHKIKAQIAPIEHIATSVESKRQCVKAIQKQLSNREQISRIFTELYEYSPKFISISELKFRSRTDEATINIKGQAKSLSNAFEYSDVMKETELLNSIQIINAQQIPRPGGSIVEFKADCLVRSN